MAAEENDLDELEELMVKVVGHRPAAALTRHLAATRADIGEMRTDIREMRTDISKMQNDISEMRTDIVRLDTAMQVGFANLETSLMQRINAQTITMIFALVAVVASISSVALFR